MKKALKKSADILLMLICLSALTAGIMLIIMRFAGMQAAGIRTSSMADIYPVGTLVVIKKTDPQLICENDIISFVADEKLTVVTHRVVSNSTDRMLIYTKGDMNGTQDSQPVMYKNVIGRAWIHFPYLGFAIMFFKKQSISAVLYCVVFVLIIYYAAAGFKKVILSIRRRRRGSAQKDK